MRELGSKGGMEEKGGGERGSEGGMEGEGGERGSEGGMEGEGKGERGRENK